MVFALLFLLLLPLLLFSAPTEYGCSAETCSGGAAVAGGGPRGTSVLAASLLLLGPLAADGDDSLPPLITSDCAYGGWPETLIE